MASNWSASWLWGGSSSSSEGFSNNDPLSPSTAAAAAESGKLLEGLEMGRRWQTRYRLIETKRLNTETVAGIKDMNLGRVVGGQKRGNPVIRFDTGHRTGHQPHINFDPRGYPSRKNLHLYVPQSMVSAAYYLQKTAEVADCFATVATYATDMYRLGAAAQLDYRSYYTARTEVHRLEGYYRQAQEAPPEVTGVDPDLDGHLCFSYQRNLRAQAILLEQVQASLGGMAVPRNALQEAASIAGGYAGGLLGATSGALLSTTALATVGTLVLGPAGTLVGSVVGAVVGSAYGGVKGAQAGSIAAEAAARKVFIDGLQQAYDDLASGAGKTADQVVGAASKYSSSAYWWFWRRWSGSLAASSVRELAGTAVSSASKCASTALEASKDTAVSLWEEWSTRAAASSVSGLASSALKSSKDAASTAWSWSSSAPSSASGWWPSSTADSSSWWTSSSSSSWWTSPSSSSAAKWSEFSKDAASTAWGWSSSAASSASAWTSSKAAASSGSAWGGWSSSAASFASSWMTSSSASDYFWKK